MRPNIEWVIEADKQFRKDIDSIIQRLRRGTELDDSVQGSDGRPAEPLGYRKSRERSLALTKLQEAVMWFGMDLKAIGEENPAYASDPYPNSKNPENTLIDKTADNLKL